MVEYLNKVKVIELKKGAEVKIEYKKKRLKTGFGGGVNSKQIKKYKIILKNKTRIVFENEQQNKITVVLKSIKENFKGAFFNLDNAQIFFINVRKKISRFELISKGK